MNETKCDLAYELTYHPIYRFGQFYSFSVSFLSVFGLSYFLIKRVIHLPFHGNLKFLLTSYFMALNLFSVGIMFAFGYHFFLPFFVNNKCDLILQNPLFKWVHCIDLFLMTVPMILVVGFSIERFVAMAFAHDYERVRTLLGPVLVIVLIGIISSINYYIYYDEDFSDRFISFILIPSTSAVDWNNFFWFLLYVDLANLICNVVLLVIHENMKTRHLRRQSTLSVRYEMQEIVISSKFTFIVCMTHFLFVGWYLSAILFVRTVGQSFFNGYINYTVARGVYCAVPTYNLIIVFIGFYSLKILNSSRSTKVRSTVQIKATGTEGAQNYEDVIWKHWDSVSKTK